jgi:hypothetical protein
MPVTLEQLQEDKQQTIEAIELLLVDNGEWDLENSEEFKRLIYQLDEIKCCLLMFDLNPDVTIEKKS